MSRITVAVFTALLVVSGCANTIRGAGQDTANTVDATGDAVNNVARSAN